jgi:hypothetical protein
MFKVGRKQDQLLNGDQSNSYSPIPNEDNNDIENGNNNDHINSHFKISFKSLFTFIAGSIIIIGFICIIIIYIRQQEKCLPEPYLYITSSSGF